MKASLLVVVLMLAACGSSSAAPSSSLPTKIIYISGENYDYGFSVFCDTERGNLIYAARGGYGGTNPAITVVPGGCK